MKKRVAIPAVLVVLVLAPLAAVALVPEWRERARSRWHVHKLRSSDRATRKAMLDALVARGGLELDAILPEAVAAAVADVSSRSVFIGSLADGRDAGGLHLVCDEPTNDLHSRSVLVERALTSMPEAVSMDWEDLVVRGPLLTFSNERTLFAAEGEKIVVAVALHGEQGDEIVAAVEERLRRGE